MMQQPTLLRTYAGLLAAIAIAVSLVNWFAGNPSAFSDFLALPFFLISPLWGRRQLAFPSEALSMAFTLLYPAGIYWCSLETFRFVWFWRAIVGIGWAYSFVWAFLALFSFDRNHLAAMAPYLGMLAWMLPALIVMTLRVLRLKEDLQIHFLGRTWRIGRSFPASQE